MQGAGTVYTDYSEVVEKLEKRVAQLEGLVEDLRSKMFFAELNIKDLECQKLNDPDYNPYAY